MTKDERDEVPEVLRVLSDDPGSVDAAVEEFLRFDAPDLTVGRVAIAPVPTSDTLVVVGPGFPGCIRGMLPGTSEVG
jgi:hypothetical protein